MEFVQPIREKEHIEEFKQLLNRGSYGKRNRFLFVLGINTALRISDLLTLRVKDVRNKSHLVMKESKTGKTKRQLIGSTLKQEIEIYCEKKEDSDFLFPSRKRNSPLSRIQAYRILNEVASLLELEEIGTHTLRKTFSYHFYKKTQDIYMLMDLLNHSSPSVTMKYIGMNQDMKDAALKDFSL
jgi:integrase